MTASQYPAFYQIGYLTPLGYSGLPSLVFTLFFFGFSYVHLTLTGLSLSGLVAFNTLTLSLQLISPNLVAGLRCLELVIAFSVQGIISNSLPDVVSSIGGTLIIFGVIILAIQNSLVKYTKMMLKWIEDYGGQSVSDFENQYTRLVSN